MALIFVDCESDGPCPGLGELTEFGAVEWQSRKTFHGVLWEANADPSNPAIPVRTGKKFDEVEVYTAFDKWLAGFEGRPVFVSDNPAFDWQWINYGFHHTLGRNPFGFSVVSVISTQDYAETFTQNRTGNAFARRATITIP